MSVIQTVNRFQLALDTIHQKPTPGIPTRPIHIMDHHVLDYFAGVESGTYRKNPIDTYVKAQNNIGVCELNQFIPKNPLTMGNAGYEKKTKSATQGTDTIMCDGMVIDSPEAVVDHLETFVFPNLRRSIETFDEDSRVEKILNDEASVQKILGPDILKSGYQFVQFPKFSYGRYGYENYFMAFALYPDLMEKHFSLQADFAFLNNKAAARAYREGNLPPMYRLDHDMADSRGTLVDPTALDKLWFPHFTRCLQPLLKADVRLIWHCDGNLMQMVPRLIDVGLRGFQGFQYEDGMDYEKICKLKSRDGEDLIIMAGASVTRTLPFGTPSNVKKELDWLVDYGPKTGLFLGVSSSVAPGVPKENLIALVEGLRHYRERN